MGKASVAVRNAAVAIADDLGVKPSRTIKGVRALASVVRDFAPRKGSEGKRPVAQVADWETPGPDGPSSWGYVVAGSPKRVISLPDDNPEYWAILQGEVLLGHVAHSFAHSVGEEFDYVNGRVSRITPAKIVMRYLRRFRAAIDTRVSVTYIREGAVGVEYWDYDQCAEDIYHVKYPLTGSARHIVERLRWISVDDQRQRDY